MQPPRYLRVTGGIHAFRNSRGERDDVVANFSLDLLNSIDSEAGMPAKQSRGFRRHLSSFSQRFGGGQLDFQPLSKFVLFAPNATHVGPGIAFDHSVRKDLGLLFRLSHDETGEERSAGAIERAARCMAHDLWMIVVLAQMSKHQRANG